MLCKRKECHSLITRFNDKDDLHLWKLQLFTVPLSPFFKEPLSWRSRHWDVAVVCNLGHPSKCRRSRERSGGDLGPLHCPGAAKTCKSFVMFDYAHGEYLMVKTIPPPVV
jgi:hypothetical protein